MAHIPKLTDDLAFIQKLGDNPNTDNGLTASELKARFDAAPLAIQKYINDVLLPALSNSLIADGGTMEGSLALLGPLILTEGVHYGKKEPSTGVEGQLYLVEIVE